MKTTNINLRVSVDLKDDFYKKCHDGKHTPSTIMRELFKLYIEKGNEVFKDEVY